MFGHRFFGARFFGQHYFGESTDAGGSGPFDSASGMIRSARQRLGRGLMRLGGRG